MKNEVEEFFMLPTVIRQLRLVLGETEQEFADRFSFKARHIRRWELGEMTPRPSSANLIKQIWKEYEEKYRCRK